MFKKHLRSQAVETMLNIPRMEVVSALCYSLANVNAKPPFSLEFIVLSPLYFFYLKMDE